MALTNNKLAIALGNFDGVHKGHARLMEEALAFKKQGFIPAALMFESDPENCLAGSPVSLQITSNKEKEDILRSMGIEKVIFIDFMSNKDLSPDEFVNMLVKEYNAGALICGFHYRFGKHAAGDASKLKQLCEKYDLGYKMVDAFVMDGMVVSSTNIRSFIASGDMERAAKSLGRYFSVESPVCEGKHLGKVLGFPTINQRIREDGAVPAHGVYITKVTALNKVYCGVSNVGLRPTVENTETCNIETNILDFDGDLYGKTVKVEFIKMLRSEKKFANTEELRRAISVDREKARKFFEK